MKYKTHQFGFSLVELMVALLLGLFLAGGVTAMYLSSKQTYRINENLSRLQESLRFSLEFMSRDIRMAGYMPCRYTTDTSNVINGNTDWYLDFFNFGIRGYEGGVSAFPTEISSDVAAGTDAIALLKGGIYAASIAIHEDSSNKLTLNNPFPANEFDQGEIAVICDPRQSSIFQISASSSSLETLEYGSNSGIAPGNLTTDVGIYGEDAQITPYRPVIYYVAPSSNNPNINSLRRRSLQVRLTGGIETAVMDEEELLEGVESMQILYGIDIDNDQITDRFVAANDVAAAEWSSVITVRLGLLLSTGEEVATQIDTDVYSVAGTKISYSTTPSHPADQKLRYVVNTTINLRNRIAVN